MEEQESQQTSKYNEAVNQLTRLNFLWQSCNELSTSGNLLKWKWRLDAVWRELSASAIKLDKQRKTPHSFFEDYAKDKKWTEIKKERIENIISKSKNRINLYERLSEYEEFLKLLQDAAGKGSKWQDQDEDDFD